MTTTMVTGILILGTEAVGAGPRTGRARQATVPRHPQAVPAGTGQAEADQVAGRKSAGQEAVALAVADPEVAGLVANGRRGLREVDARGGDVDPTL